jgi:hypothetical protein
MSIHLAETYEEVLESAKVFKDQVETNEDLQTHLSYFRAWYYIAEIDAVAPSKFIGYGGMTVAEYLKRYNNSISGSETEPRLKQWFREAKGTDSEFVERKLLELLHKYGKHPSKAVRFNVGKRWRLTESIIQDVEQSALVEVFVKAISTLRPSEKKTLIRRLREE